MALQQLATTRNEVQQFTKTTFFVCCSFCTPPRNMNTQTHVRRISPIAVKMFTDSRNTCAFRFKLDVFSKDPIAIKKGKMVVEFLFATSTPSLVFGEAAGMTAATAVTASASTECCRCSSATSSRSWISCSCAACSAQCSFKPREKMVVQGVLDCF